MSAPRPVQFQFSKMPFGLRYVSDRHIVLFGNPALTFENVQHTFDITKEVPSPFHRLKQTHSDVVLEVSDKTRTVNPTRGHSPLEGDALWTTAHMEVIGVSTADCLPVMVASEDFVVGAHAGWRGIQNEVILNALKGRAANTTTHAFIGPHILQESFEVDRPLAAQFEAQYLSYRSQLPNSTSLPKSVVIDSPTNPSKAHVDLAAIARLQLRLSGVSDEHIHVCAIDTMSSPDWASYRREGRNMGKNLSFVARRD